MNKRLDKLISDINCAIEDNVINKKILTGTINRKVNLFSREGKNCFLSFDSRWDLNDNCDGLTIIEVKEIKL